MLAIPRIVGPWNTARGLFLYLRRGSAYGIRTRDLRLERAVSLAARRMRHNFWLGILDSNQGYLIQSQASYR